MLGFILIALASIPMVVAVILERRERDREPSEVTYLRERAETAARKERLEKEARSSGSRTAHETNPGDRASAEKPETNVPTIVDPGANPGSTGGAPSVDRVRVSITGAYRLERVRPAIDMELALRLSDGTERRVVTGNDGEFEFQVAPSELPARLYDDEGVIYVFEDPADPPRYVNIQRLLPTRRYGGTLVPLLVRAEHEVDGSVSVEVFGKTLLPEGAQIFGKLAAGSTTVAATRVSADADGAFRFDRMRTRANEVHAGRYLLSVSWRPEVAKETEVEAVREHLPEPTPAELAVRRNVYLGRESDEERETRETSLFFYAGLKEAQAARDTLLWLAWNLRGEKGKEPQKRDPVWRPSALLFASDTRKLLLRQSDLFAAVSKFARPGAIDLDEWRKMLDETLPERWAPYSDSSKFPNPKKNPVASANLPGLFQTLRRLYQIESRLIYSALERSPDPRDHYNRDFSPAEEWLQALDRIDRYFQAIRDDVGIPKGGKPPSRDR